MDRIDAEARKSALNNVVWMLQRPGQLEKIDQYKKRIIQKKNSIELLLRSKIEAKNADFQLAFEKLQTSKNDLIMVKQTIEYLREVYNRVPALNEKLQEIRDEKMIHSQYVTAIENLKHIFTVPEMTEKAKRWIAEGKLLHAHQCIQELENSRDDLLLEVHKLPNQSLHDKAMLKAYFGEVQNTSNMLEGQVKLMLSRLLNTVRKVPSEIVTSLRIVEREERADQYALQIEKQFGFLAPGRPKNWKSMAFAVFRTEVSHRIVGTQVNDRETNKLWLVTYLEIVRQLIHEDLSVVKTLCVPCFPAHYNIFTEFVEMYHDSLSNHLQELISNGLVGNEVATILSWVMNTYSSKELMASDYLNVDVSSLKTALLPEKTLESLQIQFLENMKSNYRDWMMKTLDAEAQEWLSNVYPEQNDDKHYTTSSSIFVPQMIKENLEVSVTISNELTLRAFMVSLDQLINYGKSYRERVQNFKKSHFEDRSKVTLFTHYVISIINNCTKILKDVNELKDFVKLSKFDGDLNSAYERMQKTFDSLHDEASQILLEEAFLDLDKHFDELFTQKWINSSVAVDTICITLYDYFQDYNHLFDCNYLSVLKEAEKMVIRKYLANMLQKKLSFKLFDECRSVANKIIDEVEIFRKFFNEFLPKQTAEEFQNPFSLVKVFAETLKCKEIDMLSLDLHGLVDKYPNVTEDHLQRLLYFRGDISRSDAKDKITSVMNNRKKAPFVQFNDGILEKIVFTDRLLNWQL